MCLMKWSSQQRSRTMQVRVFFPLEYVVLLLKFLIILDDFVWCFVVLVVRKVINSELWHACAGPLVSLPQPGSLVYYFPQGHSEQVPVVVLLNLKSFFQSFSLCVSTLCSLVLWVVLLFFWRNTCDSDGVLLPFMVSFQHLSDKDVCFIMDINLSGVLASI